MIQRIMRHMALPGGDRWCCSHRAPLHHTSIIQLRSRYCTRARGWQGAELSSADEPVHAHSTVKRQVAMHIAYVGTPFRGLQMQTTDLSDGSTVENRLLRAAHDAGMVLPSNAANLQRLRWSRSSRTDKGVHAQSTVVSFKVEVAGDELWQQDPEGISLAQALNSRLPPEVRVLAVQKVGKRFDARSTSGPRTYHYFLPAWILCPDAPDAMEKLSWEMHRDGTASNCMCLQAFQGTHSFHNFTQRRRYRPENMVSRRASKDHRRKRQCASPDGLDWAPRQQETVTPGTADSEAAAASTATVTSGPKAETAGPSGRSDAASSTQQEGSSDEQASHVGTEDPEDPVDDDEEEEDQAEQIRGPIMAKFQWQTEIDEADRVGAAHSRHILEASADLVTLPPGAGEQTVRISFEGQSFVLHQIRHMVAAAVQVARGSIPLAFIEASLRRPSRATYPLAPSQTLMLAKSSFYAFRTNRPRDAAEDWQHPVVGSTGEALTLREAGQAAQAAFFQEVLSHEISRWTTDPLWVAWSDVLDRTHYDAGELSGFLEQHACWRAQWQTQHLASEPIL